MRSAWRGDARKTSAPKRARSNLEAPVAIISIAQHARPNVAGQMEDRRAQLTILSSEVKRIPRATSSSTLFGLAPCSASAGGTVVGLVIAGFLSSRSEALAAAAAPLGIGILHGEPGAVE